MPLSSATARVQYTLSGAAQALSVTFNFNAAADLTVVKTVANVDTLLVLNTNYTVTGGSYSTGTVTMVAGVAGDIVTIYRGAGYLQPDTLSTSGQFPAVTMQRAFDRLTAFAQQLSLKVERSFRFPISNGEAAELTVASRASALLGFDSTGAISMTTLASITTAAGAAATASAAAALVSQTASAVSAAAAVVSQTAAAASAVAAGVSTTMLTSAGALRSVVTAGGAVTANTWRMVRETGTPVVWYFGPGTATDDPALGTIRPLDYHATTNANLWTSVL